MSTTMASVDPPPLDPTEPVLVGLSKTAEGHPMLTVRERVAAQLPRLENPWIGWGGALALSLLSLWLRLWHLGTPREFSFDETYYAKDAWSMLHNGYVRDYVEGADQLILGGQTTDLWKDTPSMIVHPEVGKWLIALGEKAFGMEPYGWRVASAVVGSLMILLMCRFVRRVSGSTVLGLLAGGLLAFDGLQFVLSRLALLDIFVAFFVLAGVHCIVADRQWFRARLAARAPADGVLTGWGPIVVYRPWLLAAGVTFGLGLGTKWTALYPLAAFGVLVWAWSAGARRSHRVPQAWLRSALIDGIPAFFSLVLLAFVVYVATWSSWLMHAGEYEKHLSSTQYTTYEGGKQWPTATEPDAKGFGEVTQSLRSLWSYHKDVYTFHSHFLNDATHPYASKPLGWLLVEKPVGVSVSRDIQPGDQGCQAPTGSTCIRQVILLPTPVLWWGACLALLYSLVMWIGARDWRFGVAVVGTASTWLPWTFFDDRPIFLFYAVTTLPFMVLAVALTAGRIIGADPRPSRRRTTGVIAVGVFACLVLLDFAFNWPIMTNQLLTNDEWYSRIWLQSWI